MSESITNTHPLDKREEKVYIELFLHYARRERCAKRREVMVTIDMTEANTLISIGRGMISPTGLDKATIEEILTLLELIPNTTLDQEEQERAISTLATCFTSKIAEEKRPGADVFLRFMVALSKATPELEKYFGWAALKIGEDRKHTPRRVQSGISH